MESKKLEIVGVGSTLFDWQGMAEKIYFPVKSCHQITTERSSKNDRQRYTQESVAIVEEYPYRTAQNIQFTVNLFGRKVVSIYWNRVLDVEVVLLTMWKESFTTTAASLKEKSGASNEQHI